MRLLICLSLLLPFLSLADGLPYDERDGETVGEYVLLGMREDVQFHEVDTLRTVTLDKAQKSMLKRLFKSVPDKLTVVSAAFNDGRDDAVQNEVHCIWLRERTLGITYNADDASKRPDNYWEKAFFTSVADPHRLIITHDSKVYRKGKEMTFAEVFKLIDELAKTVPDKRGRSVHPGGPSENRLLLDDPVAGLSFSLPPRNKEGYDPDIIPASLLEAFKVYGAAKNVQVLQTW